MESVASGPGRGGPGRDVDGVVADPMIIVVLAQFGPERLQLVHGHPRPRSGDRLIQEDRGHRTAEAVSRPSGDAVGLAERGFPLPRGGAEDLVVLQERRLRLEHRHLTAMLAVGAEPAQVVIQVREPGCTISGSRLGLQQSVRAGHDDILPRSDVRPGRCDQLIVAVDRRGVDPAISTGPWLVDRVGLRGPVVEVPGLLQALSDLNEAGLDRVRTLGPLHLEGIPALVIQTDVLAIADDRAARPLELDDLPRGRRDLQIAAEPRRDVDPVIMVARLLVQGSTQGHGPGAFPRMGPGGHAECHGQRPEYGTTKPLTDPHATSLYSLSRSPSPIAPSLQPDVRREFDIECEPGPIPDGPDATQFPTFWFGFVIAVGRSQFTTDSGHSS